MNPNTILKNKQRRDNEEAKAAFFSNGGRIQKIPRLTAEEFEAQYLSTLPASLRTRIQKLNMRKAAKT
jgi:hypothetical protein